MLAGPPPPTIAPTPPPNAATPGPLPTLSPIWFTTTTSTPEPTTTHNPLWDTTTTEMPTTPEPTTTAPTTTTPGSTTTPLGGSTTAPAGGPAGGTTGAGGTAPPGGSTTTGAGSTTTPGFAFLQFWNTPLPFAQSSTPPPSFFASEGVALLQSDRHEQREKENFAAMPSVLLERSVVRSDSQRASNGLETSGPLDVCSCGCPFQGSELAAEKNVLEEAQKELAENLAHHRHAPTLQPGVPLPRDKMADVALANAGDEAVDVRGPGVFGVPAARALDALARRQAQEPPPQTVLLANDLPGADDIVPQRQLAAGALLSVGAQGGPRLAAPIPHVTDSGQSLVQFGPDGLPVIDGA